MGLARDGEDFRESVGVVSIFTGLGRSLGNPGNVRLEEDSRAASWLKAGGGCIPLSGVFLKGASFKLQGAIG
jgi:hypothetical protein